MGKLIGVLVAIVVIGGGWVLLTDTDFEGGEMPEVDVDGGEIPEVEIRGPEITTGEKQVTVPTVGIELPEDDADGEEGELADDEGFNEPDVDVDVDVEEDEDGPGRK